MGTPDEVARDQWERRPEALRLDITTEGVAPLRDLLGLDEGAPAVRQ